MSGCPSNPDTTSPRPPLPPWLRRPLPVAAIAAMQKELRGQGLRTVCESASCPNLGECFGQRTATFLINGHSCTRRCRFCGVPKGGAGALDPLEPEHVAESAARLGLRHVVVTSVTRDDLADGGADAFCRTVAALRKRLPEAGVELLIPDFKGDEAALRLVLDARPTVLAHNLETVRRLTPVVRDGADHDRSLRLLARAVADGRCLVKTGVMVGLGETEEDLRSLFAEVAASGVHILTLGQYLPPPRSTLQPERFVPPEEFSRLALAAEAAGIPQVVSGPFVRSSYHAREAAEKAERS